MSLKPVQFEIQKVVEWNEWRHECLPRLKYAAKLEIPHLPELLPCDGKCAIVGAGPSASQKVEDIRKYRRSELDLVLSVNGAHDWLLKHGIKPNIHVVYEPDLESVHMALGGDPHPDVYYYVCSHCPPIVFQQLAGFRRVLWHAFYPFQGYQQAINRHFKGEFMVGGGYATFFRSLTIAIILGYRNFDLYGVDSSFEFRSHLEGYALADIEPRVNLYSKNSKTGELKKFTSQGGLAFQASEFMEFCKINQSGLRLRVHGDGLLRHLHESAYPDQYEETQP